jgi:LysM repeat protein
MNTPSPLVPQGATPPRGKSSLYFKILMILTVHVVVIGGMLLQGCKDTSTKDQASKDSSLSPAADMTSPPGSTTASATPVPGGTAADMPQTLNPNISNAYAGATTSAAPAPQPSQPMTSVVPPARSTDLAVPAAQGETKDYVIAKGDTMAAIAHKNGLSLKALAEANPSVNPKKLQIGQKVQIPAGTAAVAATSPTGATPAAAGDAAPSEGSLYVVKSGDTLMKIAKTHGTSFKRIMAMNELKTTSIRAGQKLKMPAAKAASAEPASAPASASVAPATSPARVSAAMPATASPVAAN